MTTSGIIFYCAPSLRRNSTGADKFAEPHKMNVLAKPGAVLATAVILNIGKAQY